MSQSTFKSLHMAKSKGDGEFIKIAFNGDYASLHTSFRPQEVEAAQKALREALLYLGEFKRVQELAERRKGR